MTLNEMIAVERAEVRKWCEVRLARTGDTVKTDSACTPVLGTIEFGEDGLIYLTDDGVTVEWSRLCPGVTYRLVPGPIR